MYLKSLPTSTFTNTKRLDIYILSCLLVLLVKATYGILLLTQSLYILMFN